MAEPGFESRSFSCQSKYYNHSNCAAVLLDYIVTLARLSLVTNKGYLLTYLLTYLLIRIPRRTATVGRPTLWPQAYLCVGWCMHYGLN